MTTPAMPTVGTALAQVQQRLFAGDATGARSIAERARSIFPADAALADMAGDLAMKAGAIGAAEGHFAAATALAPLMTAYAVNHAIALQRLGRHREALARLAPHSAAIRRNARGASVRALSERACGNPAEAAKWYDIALNLEPKRLRALQGRARIALERGEHDAAARFDRALALQPGDPEMWLGKAQALEVAGDLANARAIAEQIADRAPQFIAGLTYLAGLRLAAGEADFAAPFRIAAARIPVDPEIAAAHAETLAGLDFAREAAEVAAAARRQFPERAQFALAEAVHAGSAGEFDRAAAIFANLRDDSAQRYMHEARHRLRSCDPLAADHLLARALEHDPWDIAGWALRGIAWRLSGDPRAQWLHEQPGLVQSVPLPDAEQLLEELRTLLRQLHAKASPPLGQSVRGGTQTRGILFHRVEPQLAKLHAAIIAALETYRASLPPSDERHPLLRCREMPWQLAGSWSVRLTSRPGEAAGSPPHHHAAHIHPQGLLSSALYLVVPETTQNNPAAQEGWLEIGRPPPDLGLDLPPLQMIAPEPGYLALFPSTLYHGTTPFGAHPGRTAERLTVAFDVVPESMDNL